MLKIHICIGSACHLKGSYDVIGRFQQLVTAHNLEEQVSINAAFCLGHCTEAVSVKIEDQIFSVAPEGVDVFFNDQIVRRLP